MGSAGRVHRTVLDDFRCAAFRKKVYLTIEELQANLVGWLVTATSGAPTKPAGAMPRHRCRPS